MKTTKNTPEWAVKLVEETCKAHARALPGELVWKHSSGKYSSGSTFCSKSSNGKQMKHWDSKSKKYKNFYGKIVIRAGESEFDQKLVLLHELAHWIINKNRRLGHLARFWRKAYELYELNGLDMDKAYAREKNYKTTAVVVYEQLYKGRL